ncbi:probable serine/threonine-protein kinase yakA [Scaptodrosophila lebanonensis]|uniref:Probable serine/threonine-protein kinase yakA n=1 Tax=Drosophila lebanonensis TaxID=7225 RepID=A0A6J2TMG4_DROLE|nr:probable serine/threonine-protein kinase yakA [Scaptodrosophila lebanonensis]
MICKNDVLLWFKKLESYQRIDTMCSLLDYCLPFELRFLGTCLEELGRRDSLDLRAMELRANNPQELAADMLTCQKGEPSDKKIRRKMALYLALIRACNCTCVNEIFRTLECWGTQDFTCMNDRETLLELLLVYRMAASHPVFSFHQHMKCTDIMAKIRENKLVSDDLPPQQMDHQQQHHQQQQQQMQQQQQIQQQQQHQQHPQSQQELLLQQQHALHQMQAQPPAPQQQQQPHLQMLQVLPQATIPMIFQQNIPKLLPGSDGTLSVEGPHMLQSNITIPGDTNAMLGHHLQWSLRQMPPMEHQVAPQPPQPPQASSPMLSQQSSPSSSRTTSPNRGSGQLQQQQQQSLQQHRNMHQRLTGGGKNVRRPSTETTPPPMSGADVIMSTQHVKHMDESQEGVGNNPGNPGNMSLRSIIRNGYQHPGQRMKSGGYMTQYQQQHHQQQQQQHQQQTGSYVNSSIAYNMQNMGLNEDVHNMNSNKSATTTGSEPGSSNGSCGDLSPPETPTPLLSQGMVPSVPLPMAAYQPQQPPPLKHHLSYKHQQQQQQQQLNLQLSLNGRNGIEKSYQKIYTTNTASVVSDAQSNSSGNAQQTLLISPSPTSTPTTPLLLQQQPPPRAPYSTYTFHAAPTSRGPPPSPQTLMQAAPHTAQPQTFPFPVLTPHNGELIYHQGFHASLPYPYLSVPAAPPSAPVPVPGPGPAPTVTATQLRQSAVSNNAAVQTQTQPPPTPQTQPQATTLGVCPVTGVATASQKTISCYNCGSLTHLGRDCQEASMEDVTRSATYKLDYSVSATTNSTATNTNSSAGSGSEEQLKDNMLANVTITTPTPTVAPVASGAAVATVVSSGK